MFTTWTHDNVMEEYQEPEMKRVPLEGLCLQVRRAIMVPAGLRLMSRGLRIK